jgi:hypothetical protein
MAKINGNESDLLGLLGIGHNDSFVAPSHTQRLSRLPRASRSARGVVSQSTGPFDGFAQRSEGAGVGFAPDLPDSDSDALPRSQLSRVGKALFHVAIVS